MSEYSNYDPEMTPGEKLRGTLVFLVLLGGGLFFLIREVFF